MYGPVFFRQIPSNTGILHFKPPEGEGCQDGRGKGRWASAQQPFPRWLGTLLLPSRGAAGVENETFFLQIGVASGKKTPKTFLGVFPAGCRGDPGLAVQLAGRRQQGAAILWCEGAKANRQARSSSPHRPLLQHNTKGKLLHEPFGALPARALPKLPSGMRSGVGANGARRDPLPHTPEQLLAWQLKTESGTGTILITFQHRRVAAPVLSGCSHLDPSRFRVSPLYGFPNSISIKYQGWRWLINKEEQLKVKHKMQRAA